MEDEVQNNDVRWLSKFENVDYLHENIFSISYGALPVLVKKIRKNGIAVIKYYQDKECKRLSEDYDYVNSNDLFYSKEDAINNARRNIINLLQRKEYQNG